MEIPNSCAVTITDLLAAFVLGNCPEFYLKSNLPSSSFPLEAADADGHFVDITGCQNTNHSTFFKMPATQYTEEYWLFTLESYG